MKPTHVTRYISTLLAACALVAVARSVDSAPLKIDSKITIRNSSGKFDFLEVDPVHHRLLAAHEKDDTADFIDLKSETVLKRLKLGSVVHIVVDPATGRYFASAQGEQTVVVLDGTSLEELSRVKMDGELDALVLVPRYHRLYAAHDNGTHLWALDIETYKVVGEVSIPGAPELLMYDAARDRIYLNIKTANEVVVIDPAQNKIVDHWPTAPALSPHGMGFDPVRNQLYVAGGNGKLVAMDLVTGKVTASADIVATVDQAAFDPAHNRVYCAGAEKISVVEVSQGGLKVLGDVATNATARNVAVDPATGKVWTTYTDGTNSYAQSWKQP